MSDQRERLERLRDKLSAAIDGASMEMLPQLSGQYRATLADLAKLDDREPSVMIHDDLREVRRRRRAELKKARAK